MKILVVDDEPNMRSSLVDYLALEKIDSAEASNGLSAQKLLREHHFDGIIMDLKMPQMSGLELLQWLKTEGPDIPALMISAFGEVEDAVTAMKAGAEEYLVKPFDPAELLIKLKRAVHSKAIRRELAQQEEQGSSAIPETKNRKMKNIYKILQKVSSSDSTVLITGESGTGKEVAARFVHTSSPRAEGPFIPVNVGSIPESLVESELFGYEKGAFTGADKRKIGLFEAAAKGTLFLDEIGEMSLPLQVKLLRTIQEKKIQRVGGIGQIPIDVRIVAATNRELEKMVDEGTFRKDLFYRLNVVPVHLPLLKERREDIPSLATYFLKRLIKNQNLKVKNISSEAIDLLLDYDYPGNIRELENLIERATILSSGETIEAEDFTITLSSKKDRSFKGSLQEVEREVIYRSLLKHEGNRTKAAEELGITRRTLFNKVKEYNIEEGIAANGEE